MESLDLTLIDAQLPQGAPNVGTALNRAVDHLKSLQNEQGFWWAELEANATITAEYVFLVHMLDQVDSTRLQKCAEELRAGQLDDGGWGIGDEHGSEISTTVEAYVALKLCGLDMNDPVMRRARTFISAHGGLGAVRVFTRIHLALLGLWSYDELPTIPAWVMLLPDDAQYSIYQMSSWARSCVVPLIILFDRKPVFKPRHSITIDELGATSSSLPGTKDAWSYIFFGIDEVLKAAERRRFIPGRQRAMKKAERWILAHQDDEGDWGGIYPAMAYSMLALRTLGYAGDHPVIRKGWAAIERFGIETEDRYRVQSCVSPIWDTALASWALAEAGVDACDSALVDAATWLLDKQIHHYGDWSVKNTEGRPGGWSFEFFNRFYPDCDDSSAVILALQNIRLGRDDEYRKESIERARDWVISMQCKEGGWGAFDKDNNQPLWNRIPFADHKAMLDPCTPDLTGRVVEMLAATRTDARAEVLQEAVDYLLETQREDGSWFGRWGVNFIYGTWAVLSGLGALGLPRVRSAVAQGKAFLVATQNEDGGWGEACISYEVDTFVARPSTASQTAWAVMGLLAAGAARTPAVERGIAWLLEHQNADGSWDETAFTGTGFPGHFYIRYHLYRDCFPTMALARYRAATAPHLVRIMDDE